MLGANELPLRQGFGRRPKRLYGAKAPPHRVRLPILSSIQSVRTRQKMTEGTRIWRVPSDSIRFSPTGVEIRSRTAHTGLERFPRAPLPVGAHDIYRHALPHQFVTIVLPIHHHHVVLLHGNRSFLCSCGVAFFLMLVYNKIGYESNESFSCIL